MGIQKKGSTRTTGLAVYITILQCDMKPRGSQTGFIRLLYLIWLFTWESFTIVQLGRFGERRLRNLAVFMWPTDASFPSRLRNNTRHGSCKMSSKYGLSRFHVSPLSCCSYSHCSSRPNSAAVLEISRNNQPKSQDDNLRAPWTITVKTCAAFNRAHKAFTMNPRTKTETTPLKPSYGSAQKDNIDLLS